MFLSVFVSILVYAALWGNCMLASAFVGYASPFSARLRQARNQTWEYFLDALEDWIWEILSWTFSFLPSNVFEFLLIFISFLQFSSFSEILL